MLRYLLSNWILHSIFTNVEIFQSLFIAPVTRKVNITSPDILNAFLLLFIRFLALRAKINH